MIHSLVIKLPLQSNATSIDIRQTLVNDTLRTYLSQFLYLLDLFFETVIKWIKMLVRVKPWKKVIKTKLKDATLHSLSN